MNILCENQLPQVLQIAGIVDPCRREDQNRVLPGQALDSY